MKRNKVVITIIAFVALTAAFISLLHYNRHTSQRNIAFEVDATSVGNFPIINGLISPTLGITFVIDTASDISLITPETVDWLKSNGYRVDSTFCPVAYRDQNWKLCFGTKRYTADIPVSKWYVGVGEDSSVDYRCQDTIINVIKNVNFAPTSGSINVLGLDFLSHFAIESNQAQGTLTFYHHAPSDYEILTDIVPIFSWLDLLGCGSRSGMMVDLNGQSHQFTIDTSLDLVNAKLPSSDSVYSHSNLYKRTVITSQGRVTEVTASDNEWAKIGNRAGRARVCYYDEDNNEYAINPFHFTSQDVLIDYPDGKVCFRPHYDVAKYPDQNAVKNQER